MKDKQLKILELQQEVLELSKAGRTIPVGFLVPKIINCLDDYKNFKYKKEFLDYLFCHKNQLISCFIGKLQIIHSKKIELSEMDWITAMEDISDVVFYMKRYGLESLDDKL